MTTATVHPVDDVLPVPRLGMLGLQHVLVMYAGAVTTPLVIGAALKLPKEQIALLINADLFVCGIATLIQAIGIGKIGIRLPIIMGVSVVAIGPIIAIGSNPELGFPDIENDPEHFDPEQDQPEDVDAVTTPAPRGKRGEAEAVGESGSRLVQFLKAVVAELRRVQWPDRQALTTLTGVVLGFVLIAGGYLGLLDAIFSRVVDLII